MFLSYNYLSMEVLELTDWIALGLVSRVAGLNGMEINHQKLQASWSKRDSKKVGE